MVIVEFSVCYCHVTFGGQSNSTLTGSEYRVAGNSKIIHNNFSLGNSASVCQVDAYLALVLLLVSFQ